MTWRGGEREEGGGRRDGKPWIGEKREKEGEWRGLRKKRF